MSGIDPNPLPPVNEGALSYQKTSPLLVVKQRDIWAEVDQQRFHSEALQWFGEQIIVRQLWRAEDAAIGLVDYCQQCQDSPDPTNPSASVQSRVSNVYRQSGNSFCPNCFGTTFNGGFKPTCYHLYMLAADTAQERANLSTGQFWRNNPTIQMSWYPEIRVGDLLVRVNSWDGDTPTALGERFEVSTVNVQTIRTGPGISYDTSKIVNQFTGLDNLPISHPYYSVPII
jgi:hypothetical protein